MKVLVTGEKGKVSTAFMYYVAEKYDDSIVTCISLRSEAWKQEDISGYDTVYYCIGVVDDNSPDLFKINADLAYDFAKYAKDAGIKHFIYLSSMAVYDFSPGVNEEPIQLESPAIPSSNYGKSKLAGEQAILPLGDENFHIHIVRAPSIFGRNTEAYLQFYERAARKGRILDVGRANKRSAIFVDNLSELVVQICQTDSVSAVSYYFPQNKDALSYSEFVAMVAEVKGIRCVLIRVPYLIENLLLKISRFRAIYRPIMYDEKLSASFQYSYSCVTMREAICRTYEI